MALRRLGLLEANLQAKFECARLTKTEPTGTCAQRGRRRSDSAAGRILQQSLYAPCLDELSLGTSIDAHPEINHIEKTARGWLRAGSVSCPPVPHCIQAGSYRIKR